MTLRVAKAARTGGDGLGRPHRAGVRCLTPEKQRKNKNHPDHGKNRRRYPEIVSARSIEGRLVGLFPENDSPDRAQNRRHEKDQGSCLAERSRERHKALYGNEEQVLGKFETF